ncbi:MAG TPA: helix-turn-helix domain-containing protein [Candidatus Saccharimonadales bacterium]|nr:helix-turn-helix domain-containing protein [Candidatus Saccharimonadales bacterium]
MKTVGNLLREARQKNGYTREELSNEMKIKLPFILAIERNDWASLPEYGVLVGFIKSIAHYLDVDERQAVSVLRRDYPPDLAEVRNRKDNKKEISRKFVWGPKLTFLSVICVVVLVVFGYLGFQYRKFNSSPFLEVISPKENQIVTGRLNVWGRTDPDATVEVNNQTATVDTNGDFNTEIDLNKDTKEIIVAAKSRSGKVTAISRKINFKQ